MTNAPAPADSSPGAEHARTVGRASATKGARFWLDDEGIVHVEVLPGPDDTRADAEASLALVWEVGGRQPRLMLVDAPRYRGADREARLCYAASTVSLGVAILVASPLQRVTFNIFVGFAKPRYPMRMFTSKADALAWLRGLPSPAAPG